jgi:3-hydroxybutyryl-CoA dehydrogenase
MQLEKRKVMVVGAGTMGAGITQTFAENCFLTLMVDIDLELAKKGKEKIEYFLKRKVEKGKIESNEVDKILNRILISEKIEDGADSELVIEAINENVQMKKDIFRNLSELCDNKTVLATNTSTISITLLGSETNRPDKVIGMHFFIPAPVMKLIEITPGIKTSQKTIEFAFKVSQELNKTPIKSPDTPAFLVNRLLVPMWNEAMFLVMEGNKPDDIDNAMKLGANHPMGPLELADFAGLDTVLAVMNEMYEKFGDPKYRPCPLLRKMVDGRILGRKTGQGFYDYR